MMPMPSSAATVRIRPLLPVFVPLLITALSQQAYLLVAIAIAGNLGGTDVLAAVQSVSSVSALLPRVAVAAATGFAVLVGESYGAGNTDAARKRASLVIRLSITLGVTAMGATWMLASSVTSLMGVPGEVASGSSAYLMMLAIACPAMFAFNGAIAVMRTSGSPAVTTRISIIGLAATAIVDLLLVGPAGMGAIGLGISQIGSYLLMLAMSMLSLTRGMEWKLPAPWRTGRGSRADGTDADAVHAAGGDTHPGVTVSDEKAASGDSVVRTGTEARQGHGRGTGATREHGNAGSGSETLLVPLGTLLRSRSSLPETGRMLAIGLPLAIQTACFTASAALVQSVVNSYGVIASAAFGVMSGIANVPWAVASSLGGTSTIVVSQARGAGDAKRMREAVSSLSLMAAWTLIAPCLLLCVLSRPIALAMSGSPDVAAAASSMYWAAEALYFVFALNEILLGAVKGTGDGMTPLWVNVIGVIAVRILWVAAVAPVVNSVEAAVAVIPLSWLVVCVLSRWVWGRAERKVDAEMAPAASAHSDTPR